MSNPIVGKVIEVGKMQCYPPGCNGNEAVIEVAKDQCVRISGISDQVLRWLAGHLFENVVISFEMPER
jgi:hypothetical protein